MDCQLIHRLSNSLECLRDWRPRPPLRFHQAIPPLSSGPPLELDLQSGTSNFEPIRHLSSARSPTQIDRYTVGFTHCHHVNHMHSLLSLKLRSCSDRGLGSKAPRARSSRQFSSIVSQKGGYSIASLVVGHLLRASLDALPMISRHVPWRRRASTST